MCGALHISLNISTAQSCVYRANTCYSHLLLLNCVQWLVLCQTMAECPLQQVVVVKIEYLVKYKYKPLLVSWCAECCIVHTVRGFKRNKQTNRQMATGDLQIRYVPSHFANKLLRIGIFSAIITLFYSKMEAKTLSNGMGLQ